jgi:hypothetical protein
VATPTEAPVAAGLETWSDSAGVRAEQRLVNFAGSGGQSNKDFDFGWAFVDEGRQEPGQVSQLVLVSVPAYLDALELQVETGWLDRNANPIGGLPRPGEDPERFSRKLNTIKVVLPPDYEALDTLVVGGVNPRGPWINDAKIEQDLYVAACAPAAILIPGDRLWRSTSVTLGAQIADKITVLPDMRGIVAGFDEVDPPPRPDSATEAVLPLTVWTSEGSDSPDRPVTVGIGDAAACGD